MNVPKDKIVYSRLDVYPRIICVKTPLLTTGIVSLWFEAGSRYAPKDKDGLPHFFEHLFLSKTKQYSNRKDYLLSLENNGFIYRAYTAKSLTSYYYVCFPGNEEKAIRHLLKSYQTSIIAGKDIEHEKNIVINEEQRNRVSPGLYIRRLADNGVWVNHEMSRDVFGTPKIIKGFTLQDLNDFREQYYRPNNMTIIIATPDDLRVEKIKELVNKLKSTDKKKIREFQQSKIKKRIYLSKNTDDINVALTYKFANLSFKEKTIMFFIKHLLTDGWSARLTQRLHLDKSLTYNIYSEVFSEVNTGYLRFYWTVRSGDFNLSVGIIKKEISFLRNNIISSDFLKTQINSFLINNLMYINTPHRVLQYYGQFAFSSAIKIYTYDDFLTIIKKIKPEDILNVAKKHLDLNETSLATIGKR